ncbi:response regulator [Thalassococcus sp. CAU 1522]|uniref:histidine kinase n=1 Tax=Thalassococcus arenae TaxID=2851652 RepID=A0ABS6N6M1_9RHOB|nr:response regulator [Thalassococcus arenae]MBV2359244.1 response regulator [Thalassococcus arenae]
MLADRLAQERRARLAAERLLELKQAELFAANKKLNQRAIRLTHEISETRAEVAEIRDEKQRVMVQLGQANEKIQLVEGQLWKALETMRDGFAMFNDQSQLELANPAYLAVFDGLDSIKPGASYGHILDMLVEEGIVDLQGEKPDRWRARMLDRWTKPHIPTETIRLWNGQFVKLRDRRTPDGGIVSLGIDITELMRMWSAVAELPDGFVIYDADDRLLMCNQPYRDIYKASAPAMIPGTSFEDILRYGLERGQYTDALGREEEWLEERLAAHRGGQAELEQQLEDGRWVRVYESETRDGGRVGLRIDITQIKKDQRRLQDAMIRAEAANRAKSSFLANMSHEIRTPMNGVVGMADLMMETALTDEQRLYVDTIRSSGEALLVIINDILDYSKIEADKLVLHPEPFDLERAIHEVLLLLGPTARDKGLALFADYDMFLPTRFVGDAGRVRQVLTNLIGNAIKFTNQGHVLVRVVGVPEDDGKTAIHITVEDTGIGIPADKVDHVFGEFNQVEDDRNRNFEGTGLGLAISRRLVQLMGGEVWAESELGKGSCFGLRVELPAAEPVAYETAQLPDNLRHVLIVDDQGAHRSILTKQLGALGLKTRFAGSAAEACKAISDRPDLLIVDQDLPDRTGVDLVRDLRELGHGIPAILLAANPTQVDPIASRLVATVLSKPAPRRALFAALEGLAKDTQVASQSPQPVADPTDMVPGAPGDAAQNTATLDVLVAEDNRTNQLVFSKMVGGLPLSLRFASNGLEAVAAYRDKRPDMIFMDISMPKMDGKEATREIRKIEGDGPRVPIIAVTAHAMDGDRDQILNAGLDDYLTKPLRKAALVEKLAVHSAGRITGVDQAAD